MGEYVPVTLELAYRIQEYFYLPKYVGFTNQEYYLLPNETN